MELTDSFTLDASFDEVWAVLTDVVRLAPCVPGATLLGVEPGPAGPQCRGVIALKLGALSTQFEGDAGMAPDPDRRRVVVRAVGAGAHGSGEAVITATVESISDTITQVNLDTDLTIAGRVAQLGRRIIPEVSTVLTAQFAAAVGDLLAGEAPDIDPSSEPVPDPFADAAPSVNMPEPEVLDLYDAARRPIMKRLVPAAAVVGAALVARRITRDDSVR